MQFREECLALLLAVLGGWHPHGVISDTATLSAELSGICVSAVPFVYCTRSVVLANVTVGVEVLPPRYTCYLYGTPFSHVAQTF